MSAWARRQYKAKLESVPPPGRVRRSRTAQRGPTKRVLKKRNATEEKSPPAGAYSASTSTADARQTRSMTPYFPTGGIQTREDSPSKHTRKRALLGSSPPP